MAERKRQTAYKVRVSDILNSSYIVLEGWDPNYIVVRGKKVSRVNVIAAIVDKLNDLGLLIDDGTGQIPVRSFENPQSFAKFQPGEIVIIVGRPREYNSEKYIMAEIVKTIDHKWVPFRKKEISVFERLNLGEEIEQDKMMAQGSAKKQAVEEEVIEESSFENSVDEETIFEEKAVEEEPKTLVQKIFDFIKKNDAGDGIPVDDIIGKLGVDSEETISLMIKRGDIFENRPGRVKIL